MYYFRNNHSTLKDEDKPYSIFSFLIHAYQPSACQGDELSPLVAYNDYKHHTNYTYLAE